MTALCPVCTRPESRFHARIDGFDYFECDACGSLHIDANVVAAIDAGESVLGEYAAEYWEQERKAALERAAGMSLCRLAEAILYCRRPVRRFLDVGAGPGFLLKEIQGLIDPQAETFHAVEKFPPPYAIEAPNFHIGDVADLELTFDAGICIEVVEHLTPTMLDGVIAGLARCSQPGSLWLFNTGMPSYVKLEDPGYLDPIRRGHIISWSLAGLAPHFDSHGFTLRELPGRSFGFFAEYRPVESPDFEARFSHPLEENRRLLMRHGLLYHAAFETARSYFYYAGYLQRTAWAQSLDSELRALQSQVFTASNPQN